MNDTQLVEKSWESRHCTLLGTSDATRKVLGPPPSNKIMFCEKWKQNVLYFPLKG